MVDVVHEPGEEMKENPKKPEIIGVSNPPDYSYALIEQLRRTFYAGTHRTSDPETFFDAVDTLEEALAPYAAVNNNYTEKMKKIKREFDEKVRSVKTKEQLISIKLDFYRRKLILLMMLYADAGFLPYTLVEVWV